MGVYTDAAPAWIAAGFAAFPVGGEDGKRPMINRPGRIGRRAAMELASGTKFASATGLGIWCGQYNGVTIVDVDSQSDAEVQHVIDTFGDSPVIVQTASGKAHVYYRHNGERRSIRPDKEHDIDILGEGGFMVAPPSTRPTGGAYRFLRGGLDDLRRLPRIRPGAAVEPAGEHRHRDVDQHAPTAKAETGMRNATMFRLAREMANKTPDKVTLLDAMRTANADLSTPLPDDEVVRLVGSASAYRDAGRLMVSGMMESTLILPASMADHAMKTGNLDVVGLMLMVRKYHSEPGKTFALSPPALAAANKINGWSPNRYRYAIRAAIDLGLLSLVHAGGRGKHDPSLYQVLRLR